MNQEYFKKGTLVFVHTEKYPPWPAQIDRKYEKGIYKVNFIGEKTYTKIELQKMDLFTQQRARQIHTELQDKKLSKAIFVALKQFENRKKRGEMDPGLAELLKKPLPPLNLAMYKDASKIENYSFAKFLPSISEDSCQQMGRILDKVYDYIVMPVQQKINPKTHQAQYLQKNKKIELELFRLKQLLLKQEQNLKNSSSSYLKQHEKQSTAKGSQIAISSESCISNSRRNVSQNQLTSKSQSMEKLIQSKIIQKLIMTIKAYESFREQSQKQFEEMITLLKQKFNIFSDKFRQECNRKKVPSHKDRIMLQKFQNFQAYL